MKHPTLERRELLLESGRPLTYYVAGDGPALLMINGLAADHTAYGAQVAHLARRYRCLLWDYRGLSVGDSARGAAVSIADHAQDAAAILRVEQVARAAVIGWSLGVQVALQFFADTPASVTALVLVSGGARAAWLDAGALDWLRRFAPRALSTLGHLPGATEALLRSLAPSPEVSTWARRLGLLGPTERDAASDLVRGLGKLDVAAALASMHEMERCDLSEMLATIDVPTLVIGGDRDPLTPRSALERLVQRIAGAEYLLLPGGTHFVLLDRAEHVSLRIDKLFAERGYGA